MTDLGNRYALSALKAKRASLAGEIAGMKKKLAWAEDSLRHVDACLMLLEPTGDPTTIPAKRPQKRIKLFRQGELSGTILAVLRGAKAPMALSEVVLATMDRSGIGEDARKGLTPRVRGNLVYLAGCGRIVKQGKGRQALWHS